MDVETADSLDPLCLQSVCLTITKSKQSALMCLWMETIKMGHSSFSKGLLVMWINVWGGEAWGEKTFSRRRWGIQFIQCSEIRVTYVSIPLSRNLFFSWWANSGAHSSQRCCPKSGFHGAAKNYVEFWKERGERVFCWRKRPPSQHSFPCSPFLPF